MNRKSPTDWAHEHLAAAIVRANGPLGENLRAMVPRAWPGVPWTALLGFAANGSQREITSLEELGFFGIERRTMWDRLARDPRVRELLGRDAVNSLHFADAVADQCAIGIVDVHDHGAAVWAGVGDVRPLEPSEVWAVALAFGGWSAGNGGMAGHVKRFAGTLRGIPSSERWGAFMNLAANTPGPVLGHTHPAYTALRTAQKLEAARLASQRLGLDDHWYDGDGLQPAERAAVYAALTRKVGGP